MLLRAAAENVEAALDSFADRMVQEEEQECHQTGLGEAAADADEANGNDTDDSGGETDDDIDGEPTAAQLEAEQAEAAQEAAEAAAEAEMPRTLSQPPWRRWLRPRRRPRQHGRKLSKLTRWSRRPSSQTLVLGPK